MVQIRLQIPDNDIAVQIFLLLPIPVKNLSNAQDYMGRFKSWKLTWARVSFPWIFGTVQPPGSRSMSQLSLMNRMSAAQILLCSLMAGHISHAQGRDHMKGPWDLQQSQILHLGSLQLKSVIVGKIHKSAERNLQFSKYLK